VVDERLRTSHPAIYAAGDVAAFLSPALGHSLPNRGHAAHDAVRPPAKAAPDGVA
jgi:NADPH-dependent 2,4-dienoyl-CoA reductase/sulfur reductase-like enzyme